MSRVRLVLEHTPSPQPRTEIEYHGGQLVVGRGDEADWRIEDPEKFVSRKHFVISEDAGTPVATDASTGGLYVDGASTALGLGNQVKLEDGMRLRFGDFVMKVEMRAAIETGVQRPAAAGGAFAFSFEPVSRLPDKAARPQDLPKPFGVRSEGFFDQGEREKPRPVQPVDRDDPFALDLRPASSEQAVPARRGGYFDNSSDQRTPEPRAVSRPAAAEPGAGELPTGPQVVETTTAQPMQRQPTSASDTELRDAFFRGLGLETRLTAAEDPVAEMEALGRRFRALADGLRHLLRTRAEEKQRIRAAQTIIGSANVNPLKYAIDADSAVAALVGDKGAGYLDPEAAISDSYRDLVDHQLRTWTALQAALRQMVGKFDPEAIERELEDAGVLETLIAGGRRAKLWQLYQDRFRDIARAAEERFLGEIGADFRNAYEDKGRSET